MATSLRQRLSFAFVVPTVLLFTLSGALVYRAARRVLDDELGRGLCGIAAATASQLSAELLLTLQPGDDALGTRTHRNLSSHVADVLRTTGVRRIFAVDTEGRIRLDLGGGLPIGARLADLERDRRELARVHAGEKAASEVLFEGTDGELYKTGYAPIFQAGAVVGVVGVEGSAQFFGPLGQLFRASVAIGLLALALIMLIASVTAETISRPLSRLLDAALRIGRGDLTTAVPPEPTREIGVLAGELEKMRAALLAREEQLTMMLAGVAHEVRNPMGGIELFAGLLHEELASSSQLDARKYVDSIRGELGHLRRVVEDFLAFARESRVSPVEQDALALMEEACRSVAPEASLRGVRIETHGEDGRVEADAALVRAALVNLVKNAVSASPDGGRVRVGGRQADARYRIEVYDEGPGVPLELAEKVFEPFFTTREKGTGLGLALARKIARAHQGDVELQSRERPTCFALTLPLAGQNAT